MTLSKRKINRIHELMIEGMSKTDTAKKLGISRTTLDKYYNEPPPSKRSSTTLQTSNHYDYQSTYSYNQPSSKLRPIHRRYHDPSLIDEKNNQIQYLLQRDKDKDERISKLEKYKADADLEKKRREIEQKKQEETQKKLFEEQTRKDEAEKEKQRQQAAKQKKEQEEEEYNKKIEERRQGFEIYMDSKFKHIDQILNARDDEWAQAIKNQTLLQKSPPKHPSNQQTTPSTPPPSLPPTPVPPKKTSSASIDEAKQLNDGALIIRGITIVLNEFNEFRKTPDGLQAQSFPEFFIAFGKHHYDKATNHDTFN